MLGRHRSKRFQRLAQACELGDGTVVPGEVDRFKQVVDKELTL